MLGDLKAATARNGIDLTWDDALIGHLADKSYSIKYGARNLRRLIEKEVEDRAAMLILSSFDNPVTGLHVTAQDGEIRVTGK